MSTFLKLRWNTIIHGDDETIFKIASLINQCDFVDDRTLSYFKDGSDETSYKDVYVTDTDKPINIVINKHADIITKDQFDHITNQFTEEQERRANGEAA